MTKELDAVRPAIVARLWRFGRSFRFRLTLWFVAVLGVILAGFSVFIYFHQVAVQQSEVRNRLMTTSAQLETYYRDLLLRAIGQGLGVPERFEPPQTALPLLGNEDVFGLVGPDGSLLQTIGTFQVADLNQVLQDWEIDSESSSPIHYTLTKGSGKAAGPGGAYLFVVTPLSIGGQWTGVLILGSPADPSGQLPRLALVLGLIFVGTLVIAFGGGFWLADRAMRPVQQITRTAQEIGEGDLGRRLRLGRDDELGELSDTFDHMLDRLQAAFDRQRQFAADASHELRTPLSIIELECNRALDRQRSEGDLKKSLKVIQGENEGMTRLVSQLLTLARMDSGQAVLRKEDIDLADLAADVTDRLTALARENGVTLVAGELGEAHVLGDRGYLSQLLTNLVENAIKYRGGDQARAEVETGRVQREGRDLGWLKVSDNGPGIPQEHIPHLFDRFYRIDKARTRSYDEKESQISGSGLGLAIAQSIAQAYGGSIEVRSVEGQGTSFQVFLPVLASITSE
jgi:signal transduction histidine kinase